MRKIGYFILLAALIAAFSLPVSGQEQRRRGGPMGDMFQGQTPPPGAVTVLGRSFLGSLDNGFGNALTLLIAVDDRYVREELGLTHTEAASIQLVRAQMMLSAPKYAVRFQTMTEEDHNGIQQDLSRDMERVTELLHKAISPERREKVDQFVFQSLCGLDSPLIGMSSMDVLNLTEGQKEKMQSVFDEMREERVAQMELALEMAERVIAAGGPQNLSPEEQQQLRAEGQKLESQSFETAKKLTERLRQHLSPAQLAWERELIASRPSFLPPLPKQMRESESPAESNVKSDVYTPGVDSWQPGQDLPVPVQEQGEGSFPRKPKPE